MGKIDKEKVKKDLTVSTNTLDNAVDQQAGLVWYYGEQWAEAEKKMKDAKLDLELVEAQLKNHYYAQGKITVDQMNALVTADQSYVDASEKYIQTKYDVDLLYMIMKALDHKKDSVNNKVKMFLAELYPEIKQGMVDESAFRKVQAEIAHKEMKKVIRPFKGVKK